MGKCWVIFKKVFSVSLVFNALLTVACLVGILGGYYWYYHDWEPFAPFLLSGHLLWLAIAAAIINIFPSAALGRSLHTGRFLFHHYFYGILVIACAVIYVVIFSPVSLPTLFFVDNTSVAVNLGRFFILGGLALLLDDLPDVNKRLEGGLNRLKSAVGRNGRFVLAIQLVCGVVSMYIFVAIVTAMYINSEWITLANTIVAGSIFVTGITSFIFVKRRFWLKISKV